jgi:hypothetical protein
MTNTVSTKQGDCVRLDNNAAFVQTDILRQYLMERRRALLTELRSIDTVLQLDTPAKVKR